MKRRRHISAVLFLVLAGAPAGAIGQGADAVTVPEDAGFGAGIIVSRDACLRAVRHIPAANVAYRPGVSTRGKPVAPADLDAAPRIAVPEAVEFEVRINPVDFARRKRLQRERAALLERRAVVDSTLDALAEQEPALVAKLAELADDAQSLAGRQAAFDQALADAEADIVDETGGAGETDRHLLAKRRTRIDRLRTATTTAADYVALQEEKAANEQAVTTTQTALESAQEQTQALGEEKKGLGPAIDSVEAGLAGVAARGLDETTMAVGLVRYDTRTGELTFNGEPLGGAQQAALVAACRQAGYIP